jgi:import inner membrane translocase subunit TIM50
VGAGPGRQQVRCYYLKKKTKKGPSGQAWLALAGITTTITGVTIYLLGRPEETIEGLDTAPDKYADENVVKAYFLRAWDQVKDYQQSFARPRDHNLLPDLLPPPYQKPYTLILELNNVLIHTNYDRKHGWTYQKRPGVEYFLGHLFDFYEIVIFTSDIPMTAQPLIAAMDPNQYTMYHLYRSDTNYTNAHHIKDLTHLNRPLSKVVIVDTDPKSVQFQPENSIILDKWKGDVSDKTLWDLVPLLQTIALHGPSDVRPVLDSYKAEGDGKVMQVFKTKQALLLEQEERERGERKRLSQKSGSRFGGQFSTFSLGTGVAGQRTTPPPPPSSPSSPHSQSAPVPSAEGGSTDDDSWTTWIGSWIGWK